MFSGRRELDLCFNFRLGCPIKMSLLSLGLGSTFFFPASVTIKTIWKDTWHNYSTERCRNIGNFPTCFIRGKNQTINSSCSRNMKHFGNPKKWKFAQKSQILWGKWISGGNVHKSADYWDTQLFLVSQKFHDESFFPNCNSTKLGTTFLKICLDSAYSIDSKKGLTFENPTFNSWLISKTVFD